MFETVLATALSRILGQYVEDVQQDKLHVSVMSGKFQLGDMRLKTAALNQLGLPVSVQQATVGNVELEVPWSHLRSQPVRVVLTEVFVVARPLGDSESSQSDVEDWEWQHKLARLEAYEADVVRREAMKAAQAGEAVDSDTFTTRLVNKIIDNVQVHVRSVHVRYETDTSACGVTLDELSIQSADANWKPAFLGEASQIVHKLAEMGRLAIYWDTLSFKPCPSNAAGFRQFMLSGVPTSASGRVVAPHEYILHPVSGSARVKMNKAIVPTKDAPSYWVSLKFDTFAMKLDETQYAEAMAMLEFISNASRAYKYRQLRPVVGVRGHATRWWRYAIEAVRREVHARNERFSWPYLMQRRDMRRQYTRLYAEKLSMPDKDWAVQPGARVLEGLERDLEYQDIVFFRNVARRQVKKKAAEVAAAGSGGVTGWLGGMLGFGSTNPAKASSLAVANMDEDEITELYETIDYKPGDSVDTDALPADSVTLQAHAELRTLSFSLAEIRGNKQCDIVCFSCDYLAADITQHPHSAVYQTAIREISMRDMWTKDTRFPLLLTRAGDAGRAAGSTVAGNPVFKATFQSSPLNSQADFAVATTLRSLNIVYSVPVFTRISQFFTPQKQLALGDLEADAWRRFEDFKVASAEGVEHLFKQHTTIDLDVSLHAPTILVPEDVVRANSWCLHADLGHLSMKSATQPRDLEAFHDRYVVTLQRTRVWITQRDDSSDLPADDDAPGRYLLSPIDVSIDLMPSIAPDNFDVPQLGISVRIGDLSLGMSAKQYGGVLRVLAGIGADDDSLAIADAASATAEAVDTAAARGSTGFSSLPPAAPPPVELLGDGDDDDTDDSGMETEPDSRGQRRRGRNTNVDKAVLGKRVSMRLAASLTSVQLALRTGSSADVFIDASMSGVSATLVQRPYDMSVAFKLQQLQVNDRAAARNDKEPELAHFLRGFGDKHSHDEAVLEATYLSLQPTSPDFDGFASDIAVRVRGLSSNVNKEIVASLLQFSADGDAELAKRPGFVPSSSQTAASRSASMRSLPASEPVMLTSASGDLEEFFDAPEEPRTDSSATSADAMRVRFDLESVQVSLGQGGRRLAVLTIGGVTASVDIAGVEMSARGALTRFDLVDPTPSTCYPRIVYFDKHDDADAVADFAYTTRAAEAADAARDAVDTTFKLRTPSLHVVALYPMLERFTGFLDELTGATEAIERAASQVADSVQRDVVEAIQDGASGRMHIDVVLGCPVIILPRSSAALDAFQLYLGEFVVRNDFKRSSEHTDVVVETIRLSLQKIRAESLLTVPGQRRDPAAAARRQLMQDVDFNWTIQRPDAAAVQQHVMPDVTLAGEMTDVVLTLQDEQYALLMAVLADNLGGAGGPDADAPADATAAAGGPAPATQRAVAAAASPHSTAGGSTTGSADGTDAWESIQLELRIGKMQLTLARAPGSLARFAIDDMRIGLHMYSDGMTSAGVTAAAMVLDDVRTDAANASPRIFGPGARTPLDNQAQHAFLEVKYTAKDEDSRLEVLAIRPRVNVAFDFLFALQAFASFTLPEDEEEKRARRTTAEQRAAAATAAAMLSEAGDATTSVAGGGLKAALAAPSNLPPDMSPRLIGPMSPARGLPPHPAMDSRPAASQRRGAPAPAAVTTMTVVVSMQPEVWVLERPADPESRAVVLRTEMFMQYTGDSRGVMRMMFSAQSTEAFVAQIGAHATDAPLPIIAPFSLSSSYTMKLIGDDGAASAIWDTSIGVTLDEVIVRLTYQDMRLGMNVLALLQESGSDNSGSDTAAAPDASATSSDDDDDDTASEASTQVAPGAEAEAAAEKKEILRESLSVTCHGLRVTLVNNAFGRQQNTPLARMHLQYLSIDGSDWSTLVKLSVASQMTVDYYNEERAIWEPLIEPWDWRLEVVALGLATGIAHAVTCSSQRMLDINVTQACLNSLLRALDAMTEDMSGAMPLHKRVAFTPFSIRNDTGIALSFWVSGQASGARDLAPGATAPIPFSLRLDSDSLHPAQHRVSFKLEGEWSPLEDVVVDVVRMQCWQVRAERGSEVLDLVTHVDIVDGGKVISVRGSVVVRNSTSVKLNARLHKLGSSTPELLGAIEPGRERAVPVMMQRDGAISLQPHDTSGWHVGWSDPGLLMPLEKLHTLPTSRPGPIARVECRAGKGTDVPRDLAYWEAMTVVRWSPHASRQRIIAVLPMLVLENLCGCAMEFRVQNRTERHEVLHGELERGQSINLYQAPIQGHILLSVRVQGFGWSTAVRLSPPADLPPAEAVKWTGETGARMVDAHGAELMLTVENVAERRTTRRRIRIFAPYWIVNKIGLPVSVRCYKGSNERGITAPAVADGETSPPLMYALPDAKAFLGASRAQVRVASSEWSLPYSLDAAGTSGAMKLRDTQSARMFDVAASIQLAPPPFRRTRIVTLRPRIVLINRLSVPVLVMQQPNRSPSSSAGSSSVPTQQLPPECPTPFHWPDHHGANVVRVRVTGGSDEWQWSGPFSMNELGDFAVKLRHVDSARAPMLLRVEIKLQDGTSYVLLTTEKDAFVPYRLVNRSSHPLLVRQQSARVLEEVPPHQARPYTWDNLEEPHVLLVAVKGSDSTQELRLTQLGETCSLSAGKHSVHAVVRAAGPVREVVFADANTKAAAGVHALQRSVSRALAKGKRAVAKEQARSGKHVPDAPLAWRLVLSLQGIGVSLVDSAPSELAYVSARGVRVTASASTIDQRFELRVSRFQIDNQRASGEPVVLAMRNTDSVLRSSSTGSNSSKALPHLHISLVQRTDVKSILWLRYFSVLLQETVLNLQEEFILALMTFFAKTYDYAVPPASLASVLVVDTVPSSVFQLTASPDAEAEMHTQRMYFELLVLNPVKLRLSFASLPYADYDAFSSPTGWMRALGMSLADIDRAPIALNALVLEHPFLSPNALSDRVTAHYTRAALTETYKVLGSFDFLGNPVGLFTNVGSGVMDFFFEPAQGLIKSPEEFAVGLASGTLSLVSKSLYGTFNSAAQLTGAVGKSLATLSLDDEYIREREAGKRSRPKNAGDGIVRGVHGLGKGVLDGVSGLVTKPMEGARDGGVGGFFKGVGKGLMGVAVKPTAGVFDLASNTTAGLRSTTEMLLSKQSDRVRAPRYFTSDNILRPYSDQAALQAAQRILDNVRGGDKHSLRSQSLRRRFSAPGASVMLTDRGALLVLERSRDAPAELVWYADWSDITGVELNDATLSVKLTNGTAYVVTWPKSVPILAEIETAMTKRLKRRH